MLSQVYAKVARCLASSAIPSRSSQFHAGRSRRSTRVTANIGNILGLGGSAVLVLSSAHEGETDAPSDPDYPDALQRRASGGAAGTRRDPDLFGNDRIPARFHPGGGSTGGGDDQTPWANRGCERGSRDLLGAR